MEKQQSQMSWAHKQFGVYGPTVVVTVNPCRYVLSNKRDTTQIVPGQDVFSDNAGFSIVKYSFLVSRLFSTWFILRPLDMFTAL